VRYWAYGYFLDQSPPTGSYWAGRYWSQGEYAGSIASSLDDFPAVFSGSTGSPDRTGTIAVTLADQSAAFAGTHVSLGSYWENFYWAPQFWSTNYWLNHEPSESTGTIAVTLEAFATDFDGTSELVGDDREGTIAVTLEDAAAAIAATFSPPVIVTGNVASTLDDLTSSMLGGSVQIAYVDISVPVGIAWVVTEFPAFSGTIAVTLANATSAMTGTFLPAQAVSGFINGRTDDATAIFEGTHVAPAGNVGIIVCATADATAAITGIALDPGNFQGTIVSTLEDASSAFTGEHVAPVFTGNMGVTIDDMTALVQAIFADAGVKIGPLAANTEDVTANFDGSVTGNTTATPQRLIRVNRRRTISVRRRA
jgi:hypothetical protein